MSDMQSHSRPRFRGQFQVERLEPRQLMSVAFGSSSYTVSAQAGAASVTLYNLAATSSPSPTQVVISLTGGTAVPGVDYTPTTQTVSFAAGQVSQTIQIPILAGKSAEGTKSLEIDASSAAGAAPTANAFLFITHGADTTPPTVVSTKVLTRGANVTGFVIKFSKNMAAGPVEDVNNYAIADPESLRPGQGGQAVIATRLIKLGSATYNASTHSVTLTTVGKVKKFPFFAIMDPQLANELNLAGQEASPTLTSLVHLGPLTDTSGNTLASVGLGAEVGLLDTFAVLGHAGRKLLKEANLNDAG